MAKFFSARDGAKYGPYTEKEFRSYYAAGNVLPEDLAWKEGLPAWISARELMMAVEAERASMPPLPIAPPTNETPPPARSETTETPQSFAAPDAGPVGLSADFKERKGGHMGAAIVLFCVFVVVSVLLLGIPDISIFGSSLPKCDAPEVVSKARELVKTNPIAQAFQIRDFQSPVETAYDSKTEFRTCTAIITHALGQERVSFTLEWHDKKKSLFWIEFVQ